MSTLFVFLFGYATMVSMFLLGRRLRLSHQIACDPSRVVRAEILQPNAKRANLVLTEKTRQSIL